MKRSHLGSNALLVVLIALASSISQVAATQESPPDNPAEPLKIDKVETEHVRLMLVNVVAIDATGRTVGDLELEDFDVSYRGAIRRTADTFDVSCGDDGSFDRRAVSGVRSFRGLGEEEEPRGSVNVSKRERARPAAGGRRVAIVLDYLHLPRYSRFDVLGRVKEMIRHGAAAGDEFILVALDGGLRIEQGFTSDHDQVIEALHRMQYDITLWKPEFRHDSEARFSQPMTALLEMLGEIDGPKAVVLYSTLTDAPLDAEIADITAVAAASRSTIYPVDIRGLVPPPAPLADKLPPPWRDPYVDVAEVASEVDWGSSGAGARVGTIQPGTVVESRERQVNPTPGLDPLRNPVRAKDGTHIDTTLDDDQDDGLTVLARLAADTGGRFSEGENDLTLGLARAQRDLGCVYTIGLYVEEPQEDRPRKVEVYTSRSGVELFHPTRHVFRSPETKRKARLQAAWVAPEMFQSSVVRAHLFPMQPASRSTWQAMLTVSFPVPLADDAGAVRQHEFGALLMEGTDIVHGFRRNLTIEPHDSSIDSLPTVTFVEPVEIPPGDYTLTVVHSDPTADAPNTRRIEVSIPPIKQGEMFLVGPVLGREAGKNLVVYGGGRKAADRMGGSASFQPLMISNLERPVDLVALSNACFVTDPKRGRKKSRRPSSPTVARRLLDARGQAVGWLDPVTAKLERRRGVHCGSLVDIIPALAEGGYVFEAALAADPAPHRIRFTIGGATLPGR